ncbi:COX15/CtaA family protein [Aliidiomarina soli]|uniref:Cytochrome B n=1 Tax=Aliidiomarina soli TaxID=1928574 RepID=A0A432WJN9_9GAMM|nr:COX15/CtaA family protein [Aliidiomarina soli]RUO33917.1 cytochrome B [Aliidiomarina soli]
MRNLVKFSLVFCFIVIVLGAFTRLTDAGLGCPDWPGCYGFLSVPHSEARQTVAVEAFPDAPLDTQKAWHEMIHRYAAGTLGFLVLAIAVVAIRRKLQASQSSKPMKLPIILLVLICFQAALGMWTVTMMLQPVIVMLHLLGGFATFSLLYLLYQRENDFRIPGGDLNLRKLRGLAALALVVVVGQIALGGWVAANYAAVACTELPICEGPWLSRFDLAGAFSLPKAATYEFGVHSYAERMTMHVLHRLGAIVTTLVVGYLLYKLWHTARSNQFRTHTFIITLLLIVQLTLGVSNVVFSLPLAVAVAHNAVGALLLISLVGLNYNLSRKA